MRIIIIIVISAMAIMSCRDGGTSQSSNSSSSTTNTNANPTVQGDQSVFSSTQEVTQEGGNTSSEFHYICANNCEGSSANAAGTCATCGEELIHNTAFHAADQGASNSGPQPVTNDNNTFSSKITPLGDESATSPAPAQATGDASFHYICSAGCGGGGNAQGACPSCGAALSHNTAFHTQGPGATNPGGAAAPQSGQKFPSVFNSPNAPTAAPIQNNTSGASHYICSAGCGGGGNAEGSCPSCGSPLTHNTAFHQ